MLNRKNLWLNSRDSTMELLRIIAMIMIVFHHLSTHWWFYFDTASLHLQEIYLNIIAIWWMIWNNLFILISGYFLIKSDLEWWKFIKKFLKLLLEVSFYSLMFYIICVWFITWFENVSLSWIIDSIIPFTHYRFFDTYILLYLLIPFLNKCLLQLSVQKHRILIVVLVLMNIIMLNLLYGERSNLFWFITVYVISAYVRLYWFNISIKSCIFYSIFSCFIAILLVIIERLSITSFDAITTIHSYNNYNIFIFISAFLLFLLFTKIKIKQSRNINILASATFWVYLLHENPLISWFLWSSIFNMPWYQSSLLLIPYSILAAIFVYLICSIIDIIRQVVLEIPLFNLTEKYRDPLNKWFNSTLDKIFPEIQK
jgi:surface polysaccharide O-acyltransferase-like enzyme